jgi:acetate CoA/acetoacetate CoA-transferase beta subunit
LFDSCTLPLTSALRIDMLVSEMAVTVFPEGKATPLETGPDVTVEQVVAATDAKLVIPAYIPLMQVWI